MASEPEPTGTRLGLAPILVLLLALSAFGLWWFTRPEPKQPERPPVVLTMGERIYGGYCAGCHGETGRGDGPAGGRFVPAPTDFVKGPWRRGESPEAIRKSIVEGVPPAMPPLQKLTDEELSALVEQVRKLAQVK